MIGVDIGTTSTKAVLFTFDGKVKAMHHVEYPLYTPDAFTAEQNPDEIFAAVLSTIKQVVETSKLKKEEVRFISFSSAMHSLLVVDKHGKPLTNCMTWADKRAARYAEVLNEKGLATPIYRRTGTPVHAMSPLIKLMWLNEEKKQLVNRAHKFISIKEYVFYKLFGQYIVDYSIASATGMLNIKTLNWDEEALEVAGVQIHQLSTIVPTTHYVTGIDESIAKMLGVLQDIPFIIGASDGVLSNLGLDAIKKGVVAVTIGTSGAIRTVTDQPVIDEKGRTFCYVLTDQYWVVGGSVNNGGMILQWVKEEFGHSEKEVAKRLGVSVYDFMTQIANTVKPGSEGLFFHPYLSGERAPLWNADARGSFIGLSLHHKKEHMIRAVLEGIMYNLYTVLQPIEEIIGTPIEVKASGGFARSDIWRQMMADIFNVKVTIPESVESSCLGAAVLGLYGLKMVDSLEAVSEMVGNINEHTPISEHVEVYEKMLPVYMNLMEALQPHYRQIASLTLSK
nr:gluconokinase [Metabacillus iocasae]